MKRIAAMTVGNVLAGVIIVLVGCGLLSFVGTTMHDEFQRLADLTARTNAEERVCYDHGYSKRLWTSGRAYCYKLVGGTEIVVPVEEVK